MQIDQPKRITEIVKEGLNKIYDHVKLSIDNLKDNSNGINDYFFSIKLKPIPGSSLLVNNVIFSDFENHYYFEPDLTNIYYHLDFNKSFYFNRISPITRINLGFKCTELNETVSDFDELFNKEVENFFNSAFEKDPELKIIIENHEAKMIKLKEEYQNKLNSLPHPDHSV